ncbi:BMP family lipoprotein [Lentibacillus salicampi]|uniref:BMP family ABC transporter substrate-binding protein n=1 Tax=Lentibacillus salicampi TaxID=175306 RepID=A0A4Y9AH30_9BACI|nr:BMP family protein [Lentibacillus salicampi]TFJ94715.1 BMP family ABC transporter substrate-binding protein [Lentibacillus salicampi]
MKNRKFVLLFALLLSLGMLLAACGGGDSGEGSTDSEAASDNEGNESGEEASTDFSAGMVTDVGGVDDKSFNQSAWEGLKAWGEEHSLEKGKGFDYAQSNSDSDYLPNLNTLVREEYNLVFGIGYKLEDAIKDVAEQYPDTNFAIVDSVVEGDNIASITFADHEGSFLAGVAAAKKTKTNKVGFVGGTDSDLINKFESGFRAGVKTVNPDIEIDVQYAGAFDAPDDGKLIASNMYSNEIDVIYHSSGATGNGVFAQAKDIKNNEPDREIWVIGVDRDQYAEGEIGDHNVTLTSMIKRVDNSVQEVSNQAMNGDFPGGEALEFGVEDEGVGLADTNEEAYTEEISGAVDEWKQKIIDGEVEVPQTHDELDDYLDSL